MNGYNNDNKRKSSFPKLSSEVLQGLFENGKSALSVQFIRWKLWKKWSEFVGPTIASSSEPVGYYKGTLYIWVANSTWLHQMGFMKDTLVQTLNQKLGMQYVKEIKFTLDRRNVPADAQQAETLKEDIDKIQREDW